MTVRTLVLVTIAAAVLLVAGCAPSAGGSRVAADVTPPTTTRPGPASDPIDVTRSLSDVTVTSAVHAPAARASRSGSRPSRPRVSPAPAVDGGPAAINGTATNEQLDALAGCESGRDPRKNTGNGFYGAFQFMLKTWHGMGMAGNPIDYSYEAQRDVVRRIPLSAWRHQFPGCSRRLGFA